MSSPGSPSTGAFSPLAARWAGWALLALVGSAIILWRIHDPRTFWLDEGASLQVSQYEWPDLLRATALDSHPPGGPLLRKAWRELGDVLGAPHHVLWDRGLNLAVWIPWSAFLWLGLRRLLGAGAGAAAAACIALNPLVLDGCDSIRMYGQAIMFSSGAALALGLSVLEALESQDWRARGGGWLALYVPLAVAAMYTHVFAVATLGLVGLAWLGTAWRPGWRSPHFRWGLGAQLLAVLCFLPWVPFIKGQMGFYNNLGGWQRTPASTRNLLRQFGEWFTTTPLPPALHLPGADAKTSWFLVTNLVLLGLCAAGLSRLQRGRVPRRATFWAAVAGAFVAAGFIAFTFTATRLEIANVFHGYRYNFFGGPFWVLAIICGAAGTGGVMRWRWLLPAATVLLLAQGMASTLLDLPRRLHRSMHDAVLPLLMEHIRPGQILYVGEEVIYPYASENFPGLDVRPMWEIASHPADQPDADLLLLFTWEDFYSAQTAALLADLSDRQIVDSSEIIVLGDGSQVTKLLRLRGVHHENIRLAVEHARSRPKEPAAFSWH